MDDKELFELEISKEIPALNFIWHEESGQYLPFDTQLCWIAWQVSKRSQPSVVLPEQNPMIFGLVGYEANDLHDRLTAAGIKYTIGE